MLREKLEMLVWLMLVWMRSSFALQCHASFRKRFDSFSIGFESWVATFPLWKWGHRSPGPYNANKFSRKSNRKRCGDWPWKWRCSWLPRIGSGKRPYRLGTVWISKRNGLREGPTLDDANKASQVVGTKFGPKQSQEFLVPHSIALKLERRLRLSVLEMFLLSLSSSEVSFFLESVPSEIPKPKSCYASSVRVFDASLVCVEKRD